MSDELALLRDLAMAVGRLLDGPVEGDNDAMDVIMADYDLWHASSIEV